MGPTTRGQKLQYVKESAKDPNRVNFFISRVANNWNSLSDKIIMVDSVNQFKAEIDNLYKLKGTYNFSLVQHRADYNQ